MGDRLLRLCNGEKASSWLRAHAVQESGMQSQFTPSFKFQCCQLHVTKFLETTNCVPNIFTMRTKYNSNL